MQFYTYSLTLSQGFENQYICNSNDKQVILNFAKQFNLTDLSWFLQYGDMHSTRCLQDRGKIISFLKAD